MALRTTRSALKLFWDQRIADVALTTGSGRKGFRDHKFRSGEADVLVATDIASKGLDFLNVAHVINYDMPREIEDYVHRIGRTGRSTRKGLSTTFVNEKSSIEVMSDLKYLLVESRQKIPPFLSGFNLDRNHPTALGSEGCELCGGMGHLDSNCPK
ncbi:unnamed protein product [Sphagnum compactum]